MQHKFSQDTVYGHSQDVDEAAQQCTSQIRLKAGSSNIVSTSSRVITFGWKESKCVKRVCGQLFKLCTTTGSSPASVWLCTLRTFGREERGGSLYIYHLPIPIYDNEKKIRRCLVADAILCLAVIMHPILSEHINCHVFTLHSKVSTLVTHVLDNNYIFSMEVFLQNCARWNLRSFKEFDCVSNMKVYLFLCFNSFPSVGPDGNN